MTQFVLRDDDANATTPPARLERAYAPLLDAGFTINLSVIPDVALDTLAPDGARERFLCDHPASRQTVRLEYRHEISQWIREHSGQIAPLVHGLTHARVRSNTEFGALSRDEAGARMDRGRSILEAALGTRVDGFVAPWDELSKGSIEAAVSRFRVLSTSWLDRSKLAPKHWPAHYAERLGKRETLELESCRVLRHRGGPIGPSLDPSLVRATIDRLSSRAEVCVIVLHHWMFWTDDAPHPVVRALARALAGRQVCAMV
jgi:hypothetical protein